MNRLLTTALPLSFLLVGCSGDLAFLTPDPDIFVVQAYLYAGERVDDVTVTGVLPLDADSTDTAEPVEDARVVLSRGSETFTLVPTAGAPGHYGYPGSDLVVKSGDVFTLSVTVGDITATAETVVPVSPVGLTLDKEVIEVDTTSGSRVIGEGEFPGLVVRWENDGGEFYFLATENLEEDPEEIPGPGSGGVVVGFRLTSRPTAADSALVIDRQLGYYGRYKALLYRVNDEYVDLYRGRDQDSRDLNEPPTNVRGALGIFTAFAADSAFFEVR